LIKEINCRDQLPGLIKELAKILRRIESILSDKKKIKQAGERKWNLL